MKKKFSFHIFPINHFLIGFSYQSGVDAEDQSIDVDEFNLGVGFFTITYTRCYSN
jgi:hypothetical protein